MSSWLQFLEGRGARIAGGHAADFGDGAGELAAARDATIVADLSHLALLHVNGPDAAAFLQAQLTNDVTELADDSAQWSGWCSPKGRLVASFLLVRLPDRFLILLSAEIVEAVRKRLGMYVLRSKVKIEDASAAYARIGVAGEKAGALVEKAVGHAPAPLRLSRTEGVIAIALDARRFVILASTERAPAVWEGFAAEAREAGTGAWDWTSVRSGIPTVVAATQEAFVPQMANFDLIGAVSFRKGCYPGQEIVARTQYRGGLKRRMAIAHVPGDAAPAPGESVYSPAFGAEQAAGTIANAAPSPGGGFDALVVAQIESLERDDLRWKSLQGPELRILSRPPSS